MSKDIEAMGDPDTVPAVSWSQIVAKGKSLPVPIANRGSGDNLEHTSQVLYEDPALKSTLLSQKAAQIIQATINPDSVLFSVPRSMVPKRTTVYKLIDMQISAFSSARCLSEHSKVKEDNHLIQIHFENAELTKKAIKTGFAYNGIVFQGIPCNQGHVNSIVHLQLDILFIPDSAQTLIDHLPHALHHYGMTLQIKFHYADEYFEGRISVILDMDTSAGSDKLQPLTRNLYLDKWDRYVPARFKGAPPVCYFCRQSGHLRAACPRLASQTCFGCREKGHTRRFCPYIEDEDMEVVPEEGPPVVENQDSTDEKIIEEPIVADQENKDKNEIKATDEKNMSDDDKHTSNKKKKPSSVTNIEAAKQLAQPYNKADRPKTRSITRPPSNQPNTAKQQSSPLNPMV